MNQLCGVCVAAVVHDEMGYLSIINMYGADDGQLPSNMTERAEVMRMFAVSEHPERMGSFRSRGTGYVFPVFAVSVVGMEPRCAVHIHKEGEPWPRA